MNTEAVLEPQILGTIDRTTIHLPFGLLGFEQFKKYQLLARPQEEPFMWLQMAEGGEKAFLVLQPSRILADYQPDISKDDVALLGLADPADALVFNICTVRPKGKATINLKGPIVINRQTMVGKQVIPNNASQYSLEYPLPVA